jgi:hypothetical protein
LNSKKNNEKDMEKSGLAPFVPYLLEKYFFLDMQRDI